MEMLAFRALEISVFLIIGFLLESALAARQESSTPLFNICCTCIFEGFALTVGVLFASTVTALVRKAPFHDVSKKSAP